MTPRNLQQSTGKSATLHSSEIGQLIKALGTDDPARLETAKARLTILGSRAVGLLTEALEGDNERVRLNAISILSVIRDLRAREPIIAQLIDRDSRIREASARALAGFPCQESISPLERVLRSDSIGEVRQAAIQSLIGLFEAGFDDAIREVVALLFGPADRNVRLTALGVIPHLLPRERRSLLKKLQSDPDAEIARVAAQIERDPSDKGNPDEARVRRDIEALGSAQPDRMNQAVVRLTGFGEIVIEPLVCEMVRRSRDAEYCARAGMVFRGLGAKRLRSIAKYIERLESPLPLEIIVDVVGELQDKPLIYRLKGLIDRLRALSRNGAAGGDEIDRVCAKAHLQLARIGSRVGIDDLKDSLGTPGRRVDLDVLAAVKIIGTREELFDLLRAYRKEDGWMRGQIREVFMTIMRRERLRRTNRIFASLSRPEREVFEQIMSRPRDREPSTVAESRHSRPPSAQRPRREI